jgi:hypothetical protein
MADPVLRIIPEHTAQRGRGPSDDTLIIHVQDGVIEVTGEQAVMLFGAADDGGGLLDGFLGASLLGHVAGHADDLGE